MEGQHVIYRAKQYRYEKGYVTHSIPAVVSRETAKSYLIALQEDGINGRRRGDELWVSKTSVIAPRQKPEHDYSAAWWNK